MLDDDESRYVLEKTPVQAPSQSRCDQDHLESLGNEGGGEDASEIVVEQAPEVFVASVEREYRQVQMETSNTWCVWVLDFYR